MTKQLEEVLNLPPMNSEEEKENLTMDQAIEKTTEILKALNSSEKIDHALTLVTGLHEHDTEMDEISTEAMEAYQEIKELALNMTDMHSSKMMEVAAKMLETAMEARDRKIDRKLRTIDLQLKKAKLDREKGYTTPLEDAGVEFDRNDLLRRLKEN